MSPYNELQYTIILGITDSLDPFKYSFECKVLLSYFKEVLTIGRFWGHPRGLVCSVYVCFPGSEPFHPRPDPWAVTQLLYTRSKYKSCICTGDFICGVFKHLFGISSSVVPTPSISSRKSEPCIPFPVSHVTFPFPFPTISPSLVLSASLVFLNRQHSLLAPALFHY